MEVIRSALEVGGSGANDPVRQIRVLHVLQQSDRCRTIGLSIVSSALAWVTAILTFLQACKIRANSEGRRSSILGAFAARATVSAIVVGLLAAFATLPCWAKEYGNYDVRQLLAPAATPGAGGSLNLAYLDRMLLDLSEHAANYPPQFDSPSDLQRAQRDARHLIGMFNAAFGTAPPGALLLRMALLGSYGHNLDVAEGAGFAQNHFRKLLSADANDAMGNYHYGVFLAGIGRPKESLPYLKKAYAKGVTPALYSIGIAQLGLGDKASALSALTDYQKRNPSDLQVEKLIDAIRTGTLDIQYSGRR